MTWDTVWMHVRDHTSISRHIWYGVWAGFRAVRRISREQIKEQVWDYGRSLAASRIMQENAMRYHQ